MGFGAICNWAGKFSCHNGNTIHNCKCNLTDDDPSIIEIDESDPKKAIPKKQRAIDNPQTPTITTIEGNHKGKWGIGRGAISRVGLGILTLFLSSLSYKKDHHHHFDKLAIWIKLPKIYTAFYLAIHSIDICDMLSSIIDYIVTFKFTKQFPFVKNWQF